MISTVFFNEAVLTAMNDLTTAGNFTGPLNGSKMGIYTNQLTPTPFTLLADLTVATYAGYAEVALTFGNQLVNGDGSAELLSNLASFRSTDNVTPNVGYGFFIVDGGTPGNLLMVQPFDTPVAFDGPAQGCSIVANVGYAGSDIGDSTVIV